MPRGVSEEDFAASGHPASVVCRGSPRFHLQSVWRLPRERWRSSGLLAMPADAPDCGPRLLHCDVALQGAAVSSPRHENEITLQRPSHPPSTYTMNRDYLSPVTNPSAVALGPRRGIAAESRHRLRPQRRPPRSRRRWRPPAGPERKARHACRVHDRSCRGSPSGMRAPRRRGRGGRIRTPPAGCRRRSARSREIQGAPSSRTAEWSGRARPDKGVGLKDLRHDRHQLPKSWTPS
jgi:hypothetical protein